MKISPSSVVEKTEAFVEEYMSRYDPSHDWHHVKRVVRQALRLADEESKRPGASDIDLEVVWLASLLHDVDDEKYRKLNSANSQFSISNFLQHNGLDGQRAELVDRIVHSISYRQELKFIEDDKNGKVDQSEKEWRKSCVEWQCVQDADRLESIGAFGIARCMAFSAARNRALHDPLDTPTENMTYEQYQDKTAKNEGSAVQHFDEKLFKIKDLIKTQAGKKEAEKRHNFMKLYIDQLHGEYSYGIDV